MQLPQTLLFLLTLFTTLHALALPAPFDSLSDSANALFKRKGGGGGGGRGGGGRGGGGRGGGGGGSGGRSSSGGGSRGSGGGSSGRTSPNSNAGGSTARGSGPLPSYGGSRYYAGGSAVPYAANGNSRPGLGVPILFAGAGLARFPAVYLGAAYYAYSYPYYWSYYNRTGNRNESHPAQCMCQRYQTCGCDDNNATDYVNAVANNASVAQLVRINDTDTLVVNGSLPNGTTAPGGEDSAAASLKGSLLQATGYWPLVAGVVYTMWFM